MSFKISNTRLDLYRSCGYKYYLKYVNKLEPDVTYSALHFGKALDNALNEILLAKKNKTKLPVKKAHTIFDESMKTWTGQNPFEFFKNDLPQGIEIQKGMEQVAAFQNLLNLGHKMIDCYVEDVIPQFEEVLDVQIERKIKNDDGDELTIIVDFIAKLKDGRVVLFDNKTSSKPYPKNSVETSQQLNIYSEYFPEAEYLGYVVLQKTLVNDRIPIKLHVDKPNEKKKEEVFQHMIEALDGIKDNRFDKNEKSCYSFGRPCEFYKLCKYGNKAGLKERE